MVAKNMTEREIVLSMAIWSCALAWRELDYRPQTLMGDFDGVVFDHGVGQQLFAHAGKL